MSNAISSILGRLNESDGVNLLTTRDLSQPKELAQTYFKYINSANSYRPAGNITLTEALDAAAYEIKSDLQGIFFEKVKPKTDEALVFPDSPMKAVVSEVNSFWGKKDNYNKLGLMHNRGILLYGNPGTGKSICLQQVVEMMTTEWKDVVFFAKSPNDILNGIRAFKSIEPQRRAVVCFEEADELARWDESTLLRLMDGDMKVDNILFLATTNYIDRMSKRMLRPGRFDKKVHIGMPSFECRLHYLTHKLKNLVTEKSIITDLAKKSEGLSFGHLRELIVGSFAMGENYDSVLRRLREMPVLESKPTAISESARSSVSRILG